MSWYMLEMERFRLHEEFCELTPTDRVGNKKVAYQRSDGDNTPNNFCVSIGEMYQKSSRRLADLNPGYPKGTEKKIVIEYTLEMSPTTVGSRMQQPVELPAA